MKLSIATDFASSTGEPASALRVIAEAGFTNIMWCHHWCDDFLYGRDEIAHIKGLLRDFGLALSDIHGSQGVEKCWHSPVEYRRKAGVELVSNRIRMLRELDGDGTVMMHVPNFDVGCTDEARADVRLHFDALCRSLDELMPLLEDTGCAISAENMWNDDWALLGELLARYPAERLGICYDSGHANASYNKRIESLDLVKGRLLAVHLDDNDGMSDQHLPPYYGIVDWDRLAQIIAASSYKRPLNFELSIGCTPFRVEGLPAAQHPYETCLAFAKDAHERCARFAKACGAPLRGE